mgnify:CR=1 FL=1
MFLLNPLLKLLVLLLMRRGLLRQNGLLKLIDLESGKEVSTTKRNNNYVSDVCVKVTQPITKYKIHTTKNSYLTREIPWLLLIGMAGFQSGSTRETA